MIKTKNSRKNSFTPLRYPGGKSSLFEFFSEVISRHGWNNTVYIEPYAGGAGAALSLLVTGKVKSIVINDYDDAIFAFWKSAIYHPEDFINMIKGTPVDIKEWERQKKIYREMDLSDPLHLGFATFFLNRTNRSGILNAGPIGGAAQLGEWKINARYNKDRMIEKIRLISSFAENITVLNKDGKDVIEEYAPHESSFFYIDPPYFVKGANLYLNAFKLEDHKRLSDTLHKQSNSKWLLSYDNERAILDLYPDQNYEIFSLRYSAHHSTKSGSEVMILSDAIDERVFSSINI